MLMERYILNDLIIIDYPITPNNNWFNLAHIFNDLYALIVLLIGHYKCINCVFIMNESTRINLF